MATLICNGTGNLTGASTFAGAETGALALVLNRNTIESLANNASVTSVTFTVTNAKVIDAVLIWVRQGAAGSTGTFKVDLQKGGVSQASVTVNRVDLPAFVSGQTIGMMVPVLFKLSSTATGDGGSNWTIVLTNSNGTNNVNYAAATASTTNFTRALRTTTAATPAAADDLYVVGELTGAGAHTSRTVTMDQTATTAYGNGAVNSTTVAGGGIHVAYYGTLSYGTSASTNYVLRVNGDLWVWEQGPFSIGASGSEIPRTSTAVLEFQQASASGDFGFRVMDNATVNIAGLSRTSGKNVVQTKLSADYGTTQWANLPNVSGGGSGSAGIAGPDGVSTLNTVTMVENNVNQPHCLNGAGGSVNNVTQVMQAWLKAGTGTHNRFVRMSMGDSTPTITNGVFCDIDLLNGTVGSATVVGSGSATSVTISAAVNGWYLVTLIGKIKTTGSVGNAWANLLACSASGTTSYLGTSDLSFYAYGAVLYTASAASSTASVVADTGWLAGDAVAVASTSRTAGECELLVLSANAGASSIAPYSTINPHSGTSPTQAEVGLLTRNVKIRSTSSSLATYVYAAALATVTASWAEFYYCGVAGTATKRGIEVDGGAVCNAKSITFCSIHDSAQSALWCNTPSIASLNVTFSNNVTWNVSGITIEISGSITATDWTISSNLLVKGANIGIDLNDHGGTCSNNTAVGCTNGFKLNESGTASAFGTFDGNVAHSGTQPGLLTTFSYSLGTISNFSSWRNNNSGISTSSQVSTGDLYFTNLTVFGNVSPNISWNADTFHINGGTIAGDTSFSTAVGISITGAVACTLDLQGVDVSGTGTGLAAHTTNDISVSSINYLQGVANNCKFGAPTPIPKTAWTKGAYLGLERYGQTAGDHRTELTYGQLKTDSVIYNSAAPSERMTPSNASNKLESATKGMGILVPVASGNTAAVQVAIYKSKTGDGAAYNGNQPRLIQRANSALGQTSDVVLGTYGSGTGSWNILSANTSTATDDGAFEIVVDCDGTAGWINVDDWQVA